MFLEGIGSSGFDAIDIFEYRVGVNASIDNDWGTNDSGARYRTDAYVMLNGVWEFVGEGGLVREGVKGGIGEDG